MDKKIGIKRFFFWILLPLNIIAATGLLLTFLAQYVPPSFSGIIVSCGIVFPFILYINLAFVIAWLIISYKYCLISLLLILLNVSTIDKHFQLKEKALPENCPNTIQVMSYNVQLFGYYNENNDADNKGKKMIFSFLRERNPDIVCFQEFFWDKSETLNFHTTDSILSILGLDNNETTYYQYFPDNIKQQQFFGLAVFSKYKIVNAEPIITDSSSNSAVYVDIKYRGDTIRVYDIHLTSLHLNKNDYSVSQQITQNNMADPAFEKNAKKLYRKLTESAKRRENQAKIIAEHIQNSPYPVIVCGDFNDPPASYCYNKIADNLRDSFRESGEGLGHTYHGNNMPHYRIDNILHSKQYNAFGHHVETSIPTSDHYPIYTYISLTNKK